VRVNTPQVTHQLIDGEVVIINLENGCYYSLLELAATMWILVASGWSHEEILSAVHAAYPAQSGASEATSAFLDQLLAEGLIVDGPAARCDVSHPFPASYAAPALEKFTDLQDLLMLDPIHEVDAAGWPHRPVES
jgi:hypothetical protein